MRGGQLAASLPTSKNRSCIFSALTRMKENEPLEHRARLSLGVHDGPAATWAQPRAPHDKMIHTRALIQGFQSFYMVGWKFFLFSFFFPP